MMAIAWSAPETTSTDGSTTGSARWPLGSRSGGSWWTAAVSWTRLPRGSTRPSTRGWPCMPEPVDFYAQVVGQPRAVEHLRAAARSPVHAYLLVGPPGVGVAEATLAFAADVLRDERALARRHPDVTVVERTGASILVEEIDEVLRLAVRPPSEGARKVLVLHDFHLVDQQYPRLLKTLEEPPASTVFVVTAEDVPPELATIASRCVRVDFGLLSEADVVDALVGDGVDRERALEVSAAAGGRLDRAR